jgi:hypothetical protein
LANRQTPKPAAKHLIHPPLARSGVFFAKPDEHGTLNSALLHPIKTICPAPMDVFRGAGLFS